MKSHIATCILLICLLIPASTYSADSPELSSRERLRITETINMLLRQIALLESQLAATEGKSERVLGIQNSRLSPEDLRKATYYSGSYESLYEVSGAELRTIDSVRSLDDDKEIWDMFVSLAGVRFVREHLKEFRLYDSERAEHDGFVELFEGEEKWILGVNLYDLDLLRSSSRESLHDLLIHEYGHILFYEQPDILDIFRERFWTGHDRVHSEEVHAETNAHKKDALRESYYKNNKERFVSAYATTDPLEDLVESFVSFTTAPRSPNTTLENKKVNFFYDYNLLVTARNRIR